MRVVVLECCVGIAIVLFLIMMTAIARHRARGLGTQSLGSTVAEYVWAVIPWLMGVGAAIPAARLIFANG